MSWLSWRTSAWNKVLLFSSFVVSCKNLCLDFTLNTLYWHFPFLNTFSRIWCSLVLDSFVWESVALNAFCAQVGILSFEGSRFITTVLAMPLPLPDTSMLVSTHLVVTRLYRSLVSAALFYPSPNNFIAVKLYLCATSPLSISISAGPFSCFGVPRFSSFSFVKWSFSRHREIDLEELWLVSSLIRFWLLKPA